ncbi:hypothetical protein JL721_8222 [Aureococcus anophagefferens]|nr:hypothetical protein JL721_8222 [Aureococcus anophagefferens]
MERLPQRDMGVIDLTRDDDAPPPQKKRKQADDAAPRPRKQAKRDDRGPVRLDVVLRAQAQRHGVAERCVRAAKRLLVDEQCTVPFVARYRAAETGHLRPRRCAPSRPPSPSGAREAARVPRRQDQRARGAAARSIDGPVRRRAQRDRAFRDYEGLDRPTRHVSHHAWLALRRAAEAKALKVSLSPDRDDAAAAFRAVAARDLGPQSRRLLRDACDDAWKRLLKPRGKREALRRRVDAAKVEAVEGRGGAPSAPTRRRDAVAAAGVDAAAASAALLARVAGLSEKLAAKVVAARPFAARADLNDVPGLGPKTFRNVAGFLRVANAAEPLDATRVHPGLRRRAGLLAAARVPPAALRGAASGRRRRGGGGAHPAAAADGDADLAALLCDGCLAGDARAALSPPPPLRTGDPLALGDLSGRPLRSAEERVALRRFRRRRRRHGRPRPRVRSATRARGSSSARPSTSSSALTATAALLPCGRRRDGA